MRSGPKAVLVTSTLSVLALPPVVDRVCMCPGENAAGGVRGQVNPPVAESVVVAALQDYRVQRRGAAETILVLLEPSVWPAPAGEIHRGAAASEQAANVRGAV